MFDNFPPYITPNTEVACFCILALSKNKLNKEKGIQKDQQELSSKKKKSGMMKVRYN
jgi:hypothetical protein